MKVQICILASFLLAARITAMVPAAASDASHAAEQKARFLYAVLQSVRWPPDAFQGETDPLRIDIIGDDTYGGAVDRLFADKTVGRRRVVVSHAAGPTPGPFPQVALISANEERRLAAVLSAYCHAPVLTVSDLERFAERGGVMGLVTGGVYDLILDDHEVHFVVNRTAAYQARLQIGSELLHLSYPLFSAVSPCRSPSQ